ncbi:hypothetical protein D3C77_747120 [compost metagenome]
MNLMGGAGTESGWGAVCGSSVTPGEGEDGPANDEPLPSVAGVHRQPGHDALLR